MFLMEVGALFQALSIVCIVGVFSLAAWISVTCGAIASQSAFVGRAFA